MKNMTFVMVGLLTALLLLTGIAPSLASAQYSDSITDSTNDVDHYQWSDTGYSIEEDVTRDNIDIVSVSLDESGGDLTVELEVKGTIQSDDQSNSNMWYEITMEDGNAEDYQIVYYFGQIYIDWPGGEEYGFTEPSGFDTSTLQLSFTLEEYGNPDSLEITGATTYEYTESAGSGEYYMDEASPGTSSNGGGGSGSTDDSDDTYDNETAENIIEKYILGSMLCIALAVIIPIVLIVIIIVVVLKVLSGGDEGGGQQSQQQRQQPPQQQQPPSRQQQGQQPPPPGQSGSGQNPPPPEDESGNEW